MTIDAARVDIGFMSLADLIRAAYRVKPYQISGPDWMREQRFDIVAKLPDGASPDQVPEMLQALLAERFSLKVHRESKEHSVYALVVGKNGPKLKESAPGADAPPGDAPNGGIAIDTPKGQIRVANGGRGALITGGPSGATRVSVGQGGTMHFEASKMTTAGLADMLSPFLDRPVEDMTELKGTYQVSLDLSMADLQNVARKAGVAVPGPAAGGGDPGRLPANEASDPSGGGSLFAAVQQLGLKLESRKAPVEMIMIDHLEKTPTEN
jgi:uncharacterized protein (TIGR03435 family)